MRRASGRSAAASPAKRPRSIIDASSTTTTSAGIGRDASRPIARRLGEKSNKRWSVVAVVGSPAASASGRVAVPAMTDSARRLAALPVGAARATRRPGRAAASSARMRTTVVVLPVPGPPATTASRCRSAPAAATACRSDASASGKRVAKVAARLAGSAIGSGVAAREARRSARRVSEPASRAVCTRPSASRTSGRTPERASAAVDTAELLRSAAAHASASGKRSVVPGNSWPAHSARRTALSPRRRTTETRAAASATARPFSGSARASVRARATSSGVVSSDSARASNRKASAVIGGWRGRGGQRRAPQ